MNRREFGAAATAGVAAGIAGLSSWVGIRGTVRKNPCMAICRSQQDVEIQGAWKRLIREARNSHWMMVYGDYLREVGYAARKIGLAWDNVSDAT